MTKPIQRKKRSKLAIILLAPILAIVFTVGWVLYKIGDSEHKQKQKPTNKAPTKPEDLELIVLPKEEQTLTA